MANDLIMVLSETFIVGPVDHSFPPDIASLQRLSQIPSSNILLSFADYIKSRRNRSRRRTASHESRLNSLPPKVALRIFGLVISASDEWAVSGKMPALIKALRQRPEYYHRVMFTFLKQENTYVLHEGNGWGFADMLPSAIEGIRKAKICLR